MTPLVHYGTVIISLLVIIAQIFTFILIVIAIANPKQGELGHELSRFVGKNAITFAFIVALVSMLSSLFFSDVAGYEPCKLCWFQRIFMYSQVFILGLAVLRREGALIRPYAFFLSIIGGLIAFNHVILQHTGVSILPCSAVGQSISCSKIFVVEFGYLTIPLMAFTGFLAIIMLLWFGKKHHGIA